MRPREERAAAVGFDRRRFLRLAGASVLSLVPSHLLWWPEPASAGTLTGWRWSDPATWGGRVPGPGEVAVITKKVILDINVQVAGVVVKPEAELMFHPRRSVTLKSTGNVVIRGHLRMRPETPSRVHRLVFLNVREGRFQGGGMSVLASDVGLWVMDHGILNISGSPKLAWTRTAGSVPAGAAAIELAEDPAGWQVGDRLAITPTLPPSVSKHYEAYDYAAVVAITGRTVTLSRATRYAHPQVDVGRGQVMRPEVLNLTRNVRIQGTSRGRAHVFIHSMHTQHVKYAALRYLGPRQPSPTRAGATVPVLGRYGLHFHHCRDGSRGSVVEGVVGRDIGSHTFVPHTSNGVTLRNCISHNSLEDAFWWDNRPDSESPAPATHDTLLDRCVASLVRSDPVFEGYYHAGFFLGRGRGNKATSCVAVGTQGNVNASGFKWPKGSQGVWVFEDGITHNHKEHGALVWQNTPDENVIVRLISYHNRISGTKHGTYVNRFRYLDSVFFGNGYAQVLGWGAAGSSFENLLCDAGGLAPYAMLLPGRSLLPDTAVTTVRNCMFRGYLDAAILCEGNLGDTRLYSTRWQVLDCDYGSGNQFWVTDTIHEGTEIQVQDAVLGSLLLRRKDQAGVPRPEWNASLELL
jgi:hypothetical protein